MKLLLFSLTALLISCANHELSCISCADQLSDNEKNILESRIEKNDKASATIFLNKVPDSYNHKKDFSYYVKAFDLAGEPKDIHNIVYTASRVDDIYACKDVIDFLSKESVKAKNKDPALLASLWCYKLWSDPEFSKTQ